MRLSSWIKLFQEAFYTAIRDRKVWLIPVLLFLLLMAALMLFSELAGPLSVFVYPLV